MSLLNKFIKVGITVDNVIFGFDDEQLKVLLIKRGEEPYINNWALPGYFVKDDEDIADAAKRVLKELTNLQNVYLEQVETFGDVHRHPSGRVITVAYYSLIKIQSYESQLQVGSIAQTARWFSLSEIEDLAFDHQKILDSCVKRLKLRVQSRPIGFELLPPKFTLSQLQHLYETIMETSLDKRNFRKRLLAMNLLIDLDELQEGVAHRPAKLYQFDSQRYKELVAQGKGYIFDLKEHKRKPSKVNGVHS